MTRCFCVWPLVFTSLSIAGCGSDDKGKSSPGDGTSVDVSYEVVDEDLTSETADSSEVEVDEDSLGTPDTLETSSPDVVDPTLVQGALRWDLGAVTTEDFFAYPWPSDLRRMPNGAPDLTDFPVDRALVDLLDLAAREVENGASVADGQGFSPLSSVYFGFTESIDPGTLEGQVILVDVDVRSPDYGKPLPMTVTWNETGGGYWPARTLAIHPDYQRPPRSGMKRAAILKKGIRAANGETLASPALIESLAVNLALDNPSEEANLLAPVFEVLPTLGMTAADLLAATVFTVSDPMAELRALMSWMRAEPVPTPKTLTLVEERQVYDLYEGTFIMAELFSGEPPFTDFGAGRIALSNGVPLARRDLEIPFTLTLPKAPPPPEGYPIVVYSHGLGEDHRGLLRTAAGPLAVRGIAVIGIDPPLQGTRNRSGLDDRSLVIQLSISNILGGREILRQAVLDALQVTRMVRDESFVIAPDLSPSGETLRFDASKVGFFGHSEGAQVGALLLPLCPEIGPAVFSAGGGGAAITMLLLKLPELDVAAGVADVLGIDRSVEEWALGHPVVSAAIQPLLDSADPLHLAREVFREPRERAHDLVMLEGFLDALTPPPSTEALASALGLPIAEPLGREIAGLDAQGIAPVPLPASNNLPAVGDFRPTGALLQFPELDHYIIYFNAPVRNRLFDFLDSALEGQSVLGP
jgi:hypothetical protein